jgi:uncharacterized Fe-S cluster-containing radical SAM superfamily enzyme
MSVKPVIESKGDIVMNPKTQRPIKVGSRIWLRLVKDGILNGDYTDPNVVCEIDPLEAKDEIQKRIKTLNKKQPAGTHLVRGRGVYKNKLVKRNKQLNEQEVSKKTSKIASKLIADTDDEDLEKKLETMIYNELMKNKPHKVEKHKPKYSTKSKTVPLKKQVKKHSKTTSEEESDQESEDGRDHESEQVESESQDDDDEYD